MALIQDVDAREDPFQNDVIKSIILRGWFNEKKAPGMKHPKLFIPISVTLLAYVVTLVRWQFTAYLICLRYLKLT